MELRKYHFIHKPAISAGFFDLLEEFRFRFKQRKLKGFLRPKNSPRQLAGFFVI